MARRRLTHRQQERIRSIQDRRRQNLSERAAREAEIPNEGGLEPPRAGLVIANFGPAAVVEDEDGRLYRCALRQHLETPVSGDRVVWQPAATGDGVVTAVQERRSLLTRPDYTGRPKSVAANLDEVVVVSAPRPEPNELLIDRYLVAIEALRVAALLVINKIDLLDERGLEDMQARFATYQRIGYPLLFLSTRSGTGMDEIRDRLKGHISLLVGRSGVGKSSLIKALLPDREIRIQALSQAGHGTHATTTTTLYHLPGGGDLIDSPGVHTFELGEPHLEELERSFVEFTPYLGRCRYSDCSHSVEPGCALIAAARRGEIDPRRLQSYRQLKASLETS